MDDPQSFGQWLRHRRRELDLTQDALAHQVGCARVTIRKLEADEIRPSRQLAELLAEQLGIPPAAREQFVRLGRGSVAPAPAPAAPRNNLPVHPSHFIGRERELAAIQQALQGSRLVTLTGPGGIGKTRLALQTASELRNADAYPDGVWWVELASLQTPALVGSAVAKAARVHEYPDRPLADTLADAFQAQQVLLVLDNCEHLITACARLAERLLNAGPRLKILATSREALDILGETTWPVSALTLPDPGEPLAVETLNKIESIRLFSERARAVQLGFELTDHNALAVVRICRRLSGMPLAIELAAARARMMSVEEIARRLDDRFDLLTAGSRTALPRQQTLRATIDWSFDLLSGPERILFRRLSVFAGGFSLAAAEAVAAGGPIAPAAVLDLLGQLINKSLVIVVADQAGDAAETRYVMLETILDYARQKRDESGEADDLRERHLEFFTALAQQAESGIYSPEQAAWFRRLDREVDNLRAAMSWPTAGAPADDQRRARPARQLLIVGALTIYWERGYQREITEALETLLAADATGEPSVGRAKALKTGGFVLWSSNNLPRARAYLEESAQIAEALNDPLTLAFALGFLGWTFDFLGDYEAAQAALERAVAIGRALGDPGKQAVAMAWSLLGDIPDRQGNLPAARLLFEDSIAFLRQVRNNNFLTYPLRRLAYIMLRQGDPEHAAELFGESLRLNRELDHLVGVCACLTGFAAVRLAQGRLDQAAVLCSCVEAYLQRVGVPLYAVDAVDYERCVTQVKAVLEPAALAAAWADGRAMRMDQAIEYALDETS